MKIEYEPGFDGPINLISYGMIFLEFSSDGSVTTTTTIDKARLMDMESRYQGNKGVYINALHEYLKDKYKVSLLCIWEGDHLIATVTRVGWGFRSSSPPCYIDDNQYFEENLLEAVKKVLTAWRLIT